MARKVKCQDTGEFSTSDIAYKAPDNKYYSSEKAYKDIQEKSKNRQKIIDKLADILGYTDGMKIPTIVYKKLQEYKAYDYDVILKTIDMNIQSIEWAMNNKDFDRDVNKIFYIFAIIQNNINDTLRLVKKRKEIEKKNSQENITDIKIDDLDIGNNVQKTKNIRKWLEED